VTPPKSYLTKATRVRFFLAIPQEVRRKFWKRSLTLLFTYKSIHEGTLKYPVPILCWFFVDSIVSSSFVPSSSVQVLLSNFKKIKIYMKESCIPITQALNLRKKRRDLQSQPFPDKLFASTTAPNSYIFWRQILFPRTLLHPDSPANVRCSCAA
jgi:hypothetical protein